RMRKSATGEGVWGSVRNISKEQPELLRQIETEIRSRGPMSAGQLEKALLAERRTAGWWGWSDCKRAVEWLFWMGRLTTANRRNFERVYDLTERVFPNFRADEISEAEGHRMLIRVAVKALGIATAGDLRDYFRLAPEGGRRGIEELASTGELIQVDVEGWSQPAFLDPKARLPRQLEIKALVSPFDPLLWDRRRAERLFGFRYRIEIYTPAHKREHGYYVVPFLLGNTFVARLDLKADRAASTLRVLSAHYEPAVKPKEIIEPLRGEMAELATWLKLERIVVSKRGNLAGALALSLR
ncbi:MAG TPA: crosslink repair DNA glycosylase YcaQ family protein, partial [Chthoniobacterales bacterium]|nr:crosslink repair DNA glycosylase YcaQ family protein [Chthoniobacterales bacterium]